MIDLTPLDVRRKREDFRRIFRGYDPEEVDTFLELAAERLEELVKEALTLRERTDRLQEQVSSQVGRERAVQEALVTAQELRDDIRGQAQREADDIVDRARKEADLIRKEAEAEAQGILGRVDRQLEERVRALADLERKRIRFLRSFRALLEREMDVVAVEEGRAPLEETTMELDFRGAGSAPGEGDEREPAAAPAGLDDRPATHEEVATPVAAETEDHPTTHGTGIAPPAAGRPAEPPDPVADDLPPSEDEEEADPKRWLSSLVERELSEKGDEESWS